MADFRNLVPFIKSFEGGFVNDPADRGGATNKGVTLATWKAYCLKRGGDASVEGLRRITDAQWLDIMKPLYWDACKADNIRSQSVANIIVDWAWASGVGNAIRRVQRIVGAKADGIAGPQTVACINRRDSRELFFSILSARLSYITAIVRADHTQQRFYKGWERRLQSIEFERLILNATPRQTLEWTEKNV